MKEENVGEECESRCDDKFCMGTNGRQVQFVRERIISMSSDSPLSFLYVLLLFFLFSLKFIKYSPIGKLLNYQKFYCFHGAHIGLEWFVTQIMG